MNIVVLAGGISSERDVSLVTGRGVYNALKKNGHNVILLDVYFGYEGDIDGIFDLDIDWAAKVAPIAEEAPDIETIKSLRNQDPRMFFGKNVIEICQMADIVFMGLHGDCGENGKIQAVFDLFGIKYTGTGSFSSALAMDKAVSKELFRMCGVNTPDSYLITSPDDSRRPQYPCVVKVCDGGSSVGVYIVHNEEEYKEAVVCAFKLDSKVLVEEFVDGKEYTCCVIEGKALPIVSIEPVNGFYDYKNKYQAGSTIEICPAKISDELTNMIQEEAVKAYNALGIETYARMDFLVNNNGTVYCLEANTLPGMTPTSLIPQEANAIGKSYEELCEWIIKISLDKYE